jgi:glycosyltransferase involved in cell wall biosynthesis
MPAGVRVLESWPHPAVMEAWRRSLAGIVPSVWPDPCPTVVMEAMASGRPVVGTRTGGIQDLVIDGETGFLVPPGDARAVGATMARLVVDAGLREAMGRAALRRVRQFSASAVAERIEHAYEALLGGTMERGLIAS